MKIYRLLIVMTMCYCGDRASLSLQQIQTTTEETQMNRKEWTLKTTGNRDMQADIHTVMDIISQSAAPLPCLAELLLSPI